MQQKKNSPRTGYPYKILPFTGDLLKAGKRRPEAVNEYFLIEALLRTEKMMVAHRPDDESALITKFRECGITGHDPLRGTHHALLSESIEDREWERKVAKLGYVDMRRNILDLGVLSKLPSNEYVHHDRFIFSGSPNGLADCLAYLQDTSPRFVCLRIDTAQPVEATLKRLRLLLKERHQQVTRHVSEVGFYDRLKKTPFRRVSAWFNYFRCYDLFLSGKTMEVAGAEVYKKKGSSDPDDIATEKAKTAIQRVKFVIEYAEQVAREQKRARKERIKKPQEQRPLWPPHDMP